MYTHVTISKLKAVYEACHPGAKPVAEIGPAPVAAEIQDDEEGGDELQECRDG